MCVYVCEDACVCFCVCVCVNTEMVIMCVVAVAESRMSNETHVDYLYDV